MARKYNAYVTFFTDEGRSGKNIEFTSLDDLNSQVDINSIDSFRYDVAECTVSSVNSMDWFINIVEGTSLTVGKQCLKLIDRGEADDLPDAFDIYRRTHPMMKIKKLIDLN